MSIFEAGMMICFGMGWPTAAYKTYKTKRTEGKSIGFAYLVLVGYTLGIIHKILYSLDWVLALYLLNTLFLVIDMCLYYKYRKNKAWAIANKGNKRYNFKKNGDNKWKKISTGVILALHI